MESILFRVDASPQIGLGHLMRCLTLASAFKKAGKECIFISKNYSESIIKKIIEYGYIVELIPVKTDLEEDLELIIKKVAKYQPRIIITDSYNIDEIYLRKLKELKKFLITIDDMALIHFASDIIINQNLGITASDYSKERYSKLLLGPKYAIIREEIKLKHQIKRQINIDVRNILVTMGGADIDNQTNKVITAINRIKSKIRVTIVVGPSCPYEKELRKIVANNNKFILKTDVKNMSDLMMEADIAISGGGTTCWELACLGLPSIIIILAKNQFRNVEELSKKGIFIKLGYYKNVSCKEIELAVIDLIMDIEKRNEMSIKGKKLVDGQGVKRILKEIGI